MEISVLLFGIARDIVGDKVLKLNVESECQVEELKKAIVEKFPKFEDLNHLSIAVNNEYASRDMIINENDEIALIPPVSGG